MRTNGLRSLIFATLVCLLGIAGPLLAANLESLVKAAPDGWPVIIAADFSADNASGALMKRVDAANPKIMEMNAAFDKGMNLIFSAIGLDIDVDQGLAPWRGEQLVIAVDPLRQKMPGFLMAIACKDRALAENSLPRLIGSVIRESDPEIQDIHGKKIHIWNIAQINQKMAYLISDDYVLIADSLETLRDIAVPAMQADSVSPVGQVILGRKDDLIRFAVDAEALAKSKMKGDSPGADLGVAMMAAGAMVSGGVSVTEKGEILSIDGQASPLITSMFEEFLQKKPEADVLAWLPAGSLVAASVSSNLGPELKINRKLDIKHSSYTAAVQFLIQAGSAPMGAAITSLLPRPNILIVSPRASEQEATKVINASKAVFATERMTVLPMAKSTVSGLLEVKDKEGKVAGYLGQVGSRVFFATDYRSAQKAAAVNESNNLTTSGEYRETLKLTGGPGQMNIYMGLPAFSAMGYFYESMGASESTYAKILADSLKSTNAAGMSGWLGEGKISLKMALKTDIAPNMSFWNAYASAMFAYGGGIVAAVGLPSFSRSKHTAQSSASLNNLKQLGMAAQMFANDNDGKLPDANNVKRSLRKYLKNESAWDSPFEGMSYHFNKKLSGVKLDRILYPSEVILFYEWDKEQNFDPDHVTSPDGKLRCVYADLHARAWDGPAPVEHYTPKLKPMTPAPKKPVPTKTAPKKPVKKR